MKLLLIAEDKLPSDLRHLSGDYWELRDRSISSCRAIEPYICIAVSREIKNYLEDRGYAVRFVKDTSPGDYHFHLEVDDRYIVDGSDYQFYYNKPIGQYLPPRIAEILDKNNITTIGSVIALVDYSNEYSLDWTDSGCGWSPNTNPEDHQRALQELRPTDLKVIKGRLLPIMLKIQPVERWDRGYKEVDAEGEW